MTATQLPLGPLPPKARTGILGGTFNPVHVGHLSIAQQVMNALKLERAFLMPAWVSPHKLKHEDMATPEDRLEMCELACLNMRGLAVCDWELKREKVSYTVETARELKEAYPDGQEFRFIIGADSLADLHTWKEAKELVELAQFAIVQRREVPFKESLWETIRTNLGEAAEKKLKESVVSIQAVDVSSTLIRQLLKAGEKIPGYLRRDVEDFIRKKHLYGAPFKPNAVSRIQMPGK